MLHHGERQRCQAKHSIRGHQGLISADTWGTIEGEIENLGRHLIAVRWETGLHMYVFPDEINIEDSPTHLDQHVASQDDLGASINSTP